VRILYHIPLSPFCRKVRLALAEKRIPFELRVERVWERRPEFEALNAACTVPVLQEENGFAIADSYAICEYLDEAYPDGCRTTAVGLRPSSRGRTTWHCWGEARSWIR
jgi:glutathione S-transferase